MRVYNAEAAARASVTRSAAFAAKILTNIETVAIQTLPPKTWLERIEKKILESDDLDDKALRKHRTPKWKTMTIQAALDTSPEALATEGREFRWNLLVKHLKH